MKRLFLSLLCGVCLFGSERALASMEIHESKSSSSSANSFNSSPGLGYETIVIIRDKQGSCEYSLKYPGSMNQFIEASIAPLNLPIEKRKRLKSEPVTKRVKTDSLSKGNQKNQQALLKVISEAYEKNKDSFDSPKEAANWLIREFLDTQAYYDKKLENQYKEDRNSKNYRKELKYYSAMNQLLCACLDIKNYQDFKPDELCPDYSYYLLVKNDIIKSNFDLFIKQSFNK